MKSFFMILATTLALASPAYANSYDDCILRYVAGAQNQTAVYAIERACISKTQVLIPNTFSKAVTNASPAYYGSYNIGDGTGLQLVFLISLKNVTPFDLTEVALSIQNRATGYVSSYNVDTFLGVLPPGTFLSGVGEPAFDDIIKVGQTTQFYVKINEQANSSTEFGRLFNWWITPTKGIPGG